MAQEKTMITVYLNGDAVEVPAGITVAAALAGMGEATTRRSVIGQFRGPLCGMGTCFECRVTVDGRQHQRACRVLCQPGLCVTTEGQAHA